MYGKQFFVRIYLRHIINVLKIYNYHEFEGKVKAQNYQFGWIRFKNRFFKSLNNDDKKFNKNSTTH